jgi:hypothetical protein
MVPQGFQEAVLKDHPVDVHKRRHLQKLVDDYLQPAGKQIRDYISDRNRGQLLPVPEPAQLGVEERSARAELLTARHLLVKQLQDANKQLTAALGVPEVVVPSRPKGTSCTQAELGQLLQVRDQREQEYLAFKEANPSLPAKVGTRSEVPEPVQKLQLERDKLQRAHMEAASHYLTAHQLIKEWAVYDEAAAASAAREAAITKHETRVAVLAERLAAADASSRTDAALAARHSTVQGYMHAGLGLVVTPNIVVYLLVRAAFETVFVLAGKLDELG